MKQEESKKPNLTLKQLQAKSRKCTDKTISDLKHAFMRDYTIERACRFARIHHDTYYEWMDQSEEFKLEMQAAQDNMLNTANDIINEKMITEKDKELAKWLTERRDKKRYAQRNEMTGEEGKELASPIIYYPQKKDE